MMLSDGILKKMNIQVSKNLLSGLEFTICLICLFQSSTTRCCWEKAILKAIAEGTIPNAEELDLPMDSQVCYACHGDVSKMEEVEMANDFTMGWCIECHRTTEVDMTNEYNSQYYADLHEKLKQEYGEGTKITVDAIGVWNVQNVIIKNLI